MAGLPDGNPDRSASCQAVTEFQRAGGRLWQRRTAESARGRRWEGRWRRPNDQWPADRRTTRAGRLHSCRGFALPRPLIRRRRRPAPGRAPARVLGLAGRVAARPASRGENSDSYPERGFRRPLSLRRSDPRPPFHAGHAEGCARGSRVQGRVDLHPLSIPRLESPRTGSERAARFPRSLVARPLGYRSLYSRFGHAAILSFRPCAGCLFIPPHSPRTTPAR